MSRSTWKQREALGIRDRVRLIKGKKRKKLLALACGSAGPLVTSSVALSDRIGTTGNTGVRDTRGTKNREKKTNGLSLIICTSGSASMSGECSHRVAEEAVVERLDVAADQTDRHAGHVRLEPLRMSHR